MLGAQTLGENVLGALQEFARALRRQEAHPLHARDAEGSVYFDVLSAVMVRKAWGLSRCMSPVELVGCLGLSPLGLVPRD